MEVHGGDEISFPAEHVYLLGSCRVLGEGSTHAPALEHAATVGEDLDSRSHLSIVTLVALGKEGINLLQRFQR